MTEVSKENQDGQNFYNFLVENNVHFVPQFRIMTWYQKFIQTKRPIHKKALNTAEVLQVMKKVNEVKVVKGGISITRSIDMFPEKSIDGKCFIEFLKDRGLVEIPVINLFKEYEKCCKYLNRTTLALNTNDVIELITKVNGVIFDTDNGVIRLKPKKSPEKKFVDGRLFINYLKKQAKFVVALTELIKEYEDGCVALKRDSMAKNIEDVQELIKHIPEVETDDQFLLIKTNVDLFFKNGDSNPTSLDGPLFISFLKYRGIYDLESDDFYNEYETSYKILKLKPLAKNNDEVRNLIKDLPGVAFRQILGDLILNSVRQTEGRVSGLEFVEYLKSKNMFMIKARDIRDQYDACCSDLNKPPVTRNPKKIRDLIKNVIGISFSAGKGDIIIKNFENGKGVDGDTFVNFLKQQNQLTMKREDVYKQYVKCANSLKLSRIAINYEQVYELIKQVKDVSISPDGCVNIRDRNTLAEIQTTENVTNYKEPSNLIIKESLKPKFCDLFKQKCNVTC